MVLLILGINHDLTDASKKQNKKKSLHFGPATFIIHQLSNIS